MGDPLILGGYILLSRKIIESEIWNKPPLYLKIWIYLLSKAQHQQYKGLKRGQLRTSIPEIMEECSWFVGFRKVKPTKDQVYNVLNWLRKVSESNDESNTNTSMITTTKATHGLVITIVNYNVYQNPKNYESNYQDNNEEVTKAERKQRQPNNTNNNDNNENNDNKNIYSQNTTPYEKIIELYNNICKSLPQVKKITDKRKRTIRARWKQYNDLSIYVEVFKKAEESDFLSGRNGKWSGCNFDWLINENNMIKVLEGNYDNKETKETIKTRFHFNNQRSSKYTAKDLDEIARLKYEEKLKKLNSS